MAVPCPGCGREYDVTLFQFGRTVDCACGSRVGIEPRAAPLPPDRAPRFAADAMLGRLAVWLRLLGFDTTYEAHVQDGALARLSIEEDRVLLTRDRRLPEEWRLPRFHVLRPEQPREQLRELSERYGLARHLKPLTRCSHCNVPVRPVPGERVRERVPARVFERHADFRACPACGRVYWDGSHADRIRAAAQELVEHAARAES